MTYAMKPLSCNPSALRGLSEKLVVSHYENKYGGAVKRLNAIEEALAALDFAFASIFTINGLKREQLIAMNSMMLHEFYFAGLGASDMPKAVRDALARDFGSVERWQSEFVAVGKAPTELPYFSRRKPPQRAQHCLGRLAAPRTRA